jgi:large subunit ribosomal protein L10
VHHFDRALIVELTKPTYPRKERVKPCPVNESKYTKKDGQKEIHPYERIIAREVYNWFDHSKMIGIVHINSINGEDFFKARVAFHKGGGGMQLKKYGSSILKTALTDTKYESLMELNNNKFFSTGFIFCTEHNKVSTMLKILKKIPQMTLLCGIAEGRLLSKNEFVEYANMPDIQIVRSQFANVLNLAGSTIVQNLQSHQSHLVNILNAHVRENQKTNEKAAVVVEENEAKNEPEKS